MTRLYEPYAYTDGPRANCAWEIASAWPTLNGDTTTEVAVIGGGFTGLSAALTLAEAGVEALVLEAHVPGWGASGRNGGFCCLGGARADDATLARRFGRDAADAFARTQLAAIDRVAEIIDTHALQVSRHSDGEVQLAHHPREMRGLAAEQPHYTNVGIETELLTKSALAERGMVGPEFHGGLHVKAGFGLDPGAYVTGLAHAAVAAGARIASQTSVTQITPLPQGYRIDTPRGTVTARKLVLATNGYSSDALPDWMRARYLPVQSNVLVTRPLTPSEQEAQGWTSDIMAYDSRTLLHYFRLMPDGRFLFGMRGGVKGDAKTDQTTLKRLNRHFNRMFPAWANVKRDGQWSGLVCMSPNLTPYVGPIGDWRNAVAAFAYHGNGVAMGTLSGQMAAQLLMGRDTRPAVVTKTPGQFPLGRHRRHLLRLAYLGYTLKDAGLSPALLKR